MAWPNVGAFGLVNNPLIDTPFNENSETGSTPPPSENDFLLLGGGNFLLLGGGNFLLL